MITLKTLPNATAQEVFDQISHHLLRQLQKSKPYAESPHCSYHNSTGLMCAAGCLIAPDEYKLYWEGRAWTGLVNDKAVPDNHSLLIRALQHVHDSESTEHWEHHLRLVADDFNLEFNA